MSTKWLIFSENKFHWERFYHSEGEVADIGPSWLYSVSNIDDNVYEMTEATFALRVYFAANENNTHYIGPTSQS